MIFNVLHQTVRIFLHTEEICFFLCFFDRASAIRTASVNQLAFGPERLTRRTIHSLISSLVDIALFIQAAEDLLHLLLMCFIRCTDKIVIACVHHIERLADGRCDTVNEFFRRYALFLCFFFYFLTMLICQDDLICIADVRFSGCISNRSRNIVRFLFHMLPPCHSCSACCSSKK